MARKRSSPKPLPKQRITFTLHAPEAKSVLLTGSFCDWQNDGQVLKKDRQGLWKLTIWLSPGRHEYRFLVDGEWRDDPGCAERVTNTFGTQNCVRQVTVGTA